MADGLRQAVRYEIILNLMYEFRKPTAGRHAWRFDSTQQYHNTLIFFSRADSIETALSNASGPSTIAPVISARSASIPR